MMPRQVDNDRDNVNQMAHTTQSMIRQTLKLKAQANEQMAACQAVLELHARTRQMLNMTRSTMNEQF